MVFCNKLSLGYSITLPRPPSHRCLHPHSLCGVWDALQPCTVHGLFCNLFYLIYVCKVRFLVSFFFIFLSFPPALTFLPCLSPSSFYLPHSRTVCRVILSTGAWDYLWKTISSAVAIGAALTVGISRYGLTKTSSAYNYDQTLFFLQTISGLPLLLASIVWYHSWLCCWWDMVSNCTGELFNIVLLLTQSHSQTTSLHTSMNLRSILLCFSSLPCLHFSLRSTPGELLV